MGLQTSKLTTLIPGDVLDRRYELYKIKNFKDFEYFKVYDMIEFRDKYGSGLSLELLLFFCCLSQISNVNCFEY